MIGVGSYFLFIKNFRSICGAFIFTIILLSKSVFEKKPKPSTTKVKAELLQPAGPAREIPLGGGKSHIAVAPGDSDFTNAAVWKIKLPAYWSAGLRPGVLASAEPGRCPALLRIRYVGDVARLTLNGKLIDDNFYSGR